MRLEFKLKQKPETRRCKKESRGPVAKEVGMGNPAEKTTRHPTRCMITEDRWVLAREFFENFSLRLSNILTHRQSLDLLWQCLSINQPLLRPPFIPITA